MIYYAMIICGAVVATAMFLVNYAVIAGKKVTVKSTVVSLGCLVVALVLAWLFNFATHPELYGEPINEIGIQLGFHYYYFCIFFTVLIMLVLPPMKLDSVAFLESLAPSLALLGGLTKIGCSSVGCCGGIVLLGLRVPTAQIEAVVCFGAFFALQFGLKHNRMRNFTIFYAVFRLLIEFVRVGTGAVTLLGIFTPPQWVATAVIIAVIINFGAFSSRKRGEEEERIIASAE